MTIPVALALVTVMVVGMVLFQPWKLFVNEQVDEAFPGATTTAVATPPSPVPATSTASSDPAPAPSTAPQPAADLIRVLASGSFIGHEHATSGAVQVLQLPDGSRTLRIENLDTSNGPDLKVWLTNAPVIDGVDGWGVFDDGQWVDLGALKGNQGSQNYAVPADLDLSGLTSVSIWCDRFNVSFGAASLAYA